MVKEVCKECGSAWYTDVRNECMSEKCSIGIKIYLEKNNPDDDDWDCEDDE